MEFLKTLISADKIVDLIIAFIGTGAAFLLTLAFERSRDKKKNRSSVENVIDDLKNAKEKLENVLKIAEIDNAEKLLKKIQAGLRNNITVQLTDEEKYVFYDAYSVLSKYNSDFDLPLIRATINTAVIFDFEPKQKNTVLKLFSQFEDFSKFINGIDDFENSFEIHKKTVGTAITKIEYILHSSEWENL